MNRSWLAPVVLLASGVAWMLAGTADDSTPATGFRGPTTQGSDSATRSDPLDRSPRAEPDRDSIPPAPSAGAPQAPAEVPPLDSATLEVRLSFDDEPLPAATVELVPFEVSPGFLVGDASPALAARATTDTRGIARFERRRPGDYGLLASSPILAEGRTRILLTPDSDVVERSLRFGSAIVEGRVHDLDGRTAPDVRVVARQNARAGELPLWFVARTDAGGNYRLAGIAGGTARAIVASVLDVPLGDSAPFEILPGATHRLDFGSAGGRARWSGNVRLPSGQILHGPARLFFTARNDATIVTSFFDEEGRFDVVVPAGGYAARVDGPNGSPLGSAEVFGAVVQDLVAPPIVLHGRLRYVGTKHPVAKGPEHDVLVTLERNDGAPVRPGFLHVDSRYAWFGLDAGSYVLTPSPWIMAGSTEGGAVIEIGPGTEEMELDLAITDP